MARKWDYKASSPIITDDFKDEFYMSIKGKQAIKVSGIVALAHEKGIKKLTTTIVQFPNTENNNMCIVEARVIGYDWDQISQKVTEVEFSSVGDASPSNCSKMVAAAFIRMAESRAIGRCLGKYINIGMVSSEELFEVVEVEPITKKQIQVIIDLKKKFAITKAKGNEMLKSMGTDFANLSKDQAYQFIDKLKQFGAYSQPPDDDIEADE